MNKKLKSWLSANCNVKETASDAEFQTALGKALADGTLGTSQYQELAKEPQADAADSLRKSIESLTSVVSTMAAKMAKDEEAREQASKANGEAQAKAAKEAEAVAAKEAEALAAKAAKEAEEKALESTKTAPPAWHKGLSTLMRTPVPVDENNQPRVKGAWENYETTKTALVHPSQTKSGTPNSLAGRPVKDFSDGGRNLDTLSELDLAVCGAFAKFLCATAQRGGSKTFGLQALNEHDRELMFYALDRMPWGGATDGGDFGDIKNRRLTALEQKSLIDDGTSGGLEAAPIVFDDQIIQTPLLHGELYPLVNVVPLDRGRRIEGVATGTVTSSWGGVDSTAVALFNTAGYVTAFDTTIFRWEGAIRVGLDFLSDTPIDFGLHITQQYGERLLEDLDDVIAAGNGSTQPEGIIGKSGATSVNFGGTTTIGNYESLRFGVKKNEHKGVFNSSAVFCGNETSYQRAKAIPVSSTDARRLFGSTVTVGGNSGIDNYSILDRPYKINESLSNNQVFYAIMGRYRMYRRRGLVLRSSTEGDTLIRNNEMLMVAMCRYGGQMERGACTSRTTTAPA